MPIALILFSRRQSVLFFLCINFIIALFGDFWYSCRGKTCFQTKDLREMQILCAKRKREDNSNNERGGD